MAIREFYVVIEKDEEGYLIGQVPQLHGCHSYGRTMDELMANMEEVILLCLEDEEETEELSEFVGIHKVCVDFIADGLPQAAGT